MGGSHSLHLNKGIFFMLGAAFFFSLMQVLAKLSMERIPFMQVVFFRALVTFLCLAPWMRWKKIPYFGHNHFWLFVRSASGFVALSLSFYVTSKMPLADATLLNHTSPLFVALLSFVFLKEKVTPLLVMLILGALLGCVVIIRPGFNFEAVSGFLGLLSGFFASLAYISIKKLHKTESFFTMVFNFSLASVVGSLLVGGTSFIRPTVFEVTSLICLGLFGTLAQLMMTYAYKFGKASVISPYSFMGVIFAVLWGFLIWHEVPPVGTLVGALLIIACGVGIMKLEKPTLVRD